MISCVGCISERLQLLFPPVRFVSRGKSNAWVNISCNFGSLFWGAIMKNFWELGKIAVRKIGLALGVGTVFFAFPQSVSGNGYIIHNEWRNPAPAVYMDVWSGIDAKSGKLQTSVIIEVAPTDLVFENTGNGFLATYEIDLAIIREDGQRIESNQLSDTVWVREYDDIAAYKWNRYFRINFGLPNGYYRAEAAVTDKNINKALVKGIQFNVDLEKPYAVDISDLMLGKKDVIQLQGKGRIASVLPDAHRVYGLNRDRMYYYFEIYTQNPSPNDSAEYIVQIIRDDRVEEISRNVLPLKRARIPVMGTVYTAAFDPGNCRLAVAVYPRKGQVHLERQKPYAIFQSPTDLRFRDADEILQEIRLIASHDEWEYLNSLAKTEPGADVLQAAIDAFWLDRDPTPKTQFNELMAEFYERTITAKILFQQGSNTPFNLNDRSKVYVMLGQPDNIARQSDGSMMGYYEIWQYRSHKLQVIFQDDMGYGNFRLINPGNLLSEAY